MEHGALGVSSSLSGPPGSWIDTGVVYVVVNGQVVLDRGPHTGARPGVILYGPGYSARNAAIGSMRDARRAGR